MRPRSLFSTSVWWVSARPSSQGLPACRIEVSGDAPVPAVVAGDGDMIRVGLGNTRSDRADTDFRDQLDADARFRVDVLEVVDQLCQILDGIDIVVRRRRDQADAGRRVTDLGNDRIDFVAGQLAAFARLGALRHLDLDVVGIHQIFGSDTKAS